MKAENALADYTLCKNEALDAKEIDLFKSFTREQTIHNIIKNLRRDIQQAEAASGYKAVDLYQGSISRITSVSVRIDDVSNELTAFKTAFMRELLKDKAASKTV